jgi:hypothetical protein
MQDQSRSQAKAECPGSDPDPRGGKVIGSRATEERLKQPRSAAVNRCRDH